MMKTLLVLVLALIAVSAAFAPRYRRLVNTEEEMDKAHKTQDTRTLECAEITPCAWQIYAGSPERVVDYIVNTYCVCNSTTVCKVSEDYPTLSYNVLRCRP